GLGRWPEVLETCADADRRGLLEVARDARAIACWKTGRFEEAFTLARAGLATRESMETVTPGKMMVVLEGAAKQTGRAPDEVDRIFAQASEAAYADGRWQLIVARAAIALDAGRRDDARTLLQQALAIATGERTTSTRNALQMLDRGDQGDV